MDANKVQITRCLDQDGLVMASAGLQRPRQRETGLGRCVIMRKELFVNTLLSSGWYVSPFLQQVGIPNKCGYRQYHPVNDVPALLATSCVGT